MMHAAICECWARDGIQPEQFVPTDRKLAMLSQIGGTGVTRMELTSFAHPAVWPQFADAAEVVASYDRRPGIEYVVLVPNVKGLERAVAAQRGERRIDLVTAIVAASESYNAKNVGTSVEQSLRVMAEIIAKAHESGLRVIACVGTAWACPIEGPTPTARVRELAERLTAAGADEIMLGDTTGESNPVTAGALVAEVSGACAVPVIGHFHDSRGAAMSNAVAAVAAGARWVDCALGGTGGHPPEPGVQASTAGNLCTEDFVTMATAAGLMDGPDPAATLRAGELAEATLGRSLTSRALRAGLPAMGASGPA
jgi:hydroxymethylglutaryl-CoA lyase